MVVELNSFICNKNIGAKAKSLIDLYRYGYKVPRSIALDIDEFNELLVNVKYKIDAVIDNLTEENILESANSIEIFMNKLRLNKSSLESLQKFINIDDKYIIRCSVENKDDYSFAGLFPVRINITDENIEDEIISCYKSLYSYNSLVYMLRNNINIKEVSMAIIIQNVIDTDLYATVTSLNPVTLKTSELNISINYNDKSEYYNYDYLEERYTEADRYNLISEEELDSIVNISKNIQSSFGYPIVFDLAITKNNIYVLQVRELSNLIYSNQSYNWNKIDMSSKNLGYSLVNNSINIVTSEIENKYKLNIDMKKIDIIFNGIYVNNNYFSKLLNYIVDYDDSYIKDIDRDNNWKLRFKRKGILKKLLKSISFDNDYSCYEDKYTDYLKHMKHMLPSDIEKYWLKLIYEDYSKLLNEYIYQKLYCFIYKNYLINKWCNNISINDIDIISKKEILLPSYKRNLEYNDLIRIIKNDEQAYRYWFSSSTTKILKNYEDKVDIHFHNEFKKYINNYGYLSYFKMDLSEKFYVEDVEEVIRHIKKSLSNFTILEDNSEEIDDIINKTIDNLSKSKTKKFINDIDKLQIMYTDLDILNEYRLKYNFLVKRYTKILANFYIVKKRIENESDIWYLDIDDLNNFIDGEFDSDTLKNIIEKNKLYFNSYRNSNVIQSFGTKKQTINKPNYVGVGYSNGIVTGNIHFINSIKDLKHLKETDIFVTKNLNHTLLFQLPKVKGIILSTEHIPFTLSAVIREMNIPCILLDNCSKKLSNGMIVEMDGLEGSIKIKKQ